MIMHVITNYTNNEGAQRMLSRLLGRDDCERVVIVSLIDVSESMKAQSKNIHAVYVSLGMNSCLATLTGLRQLKQLVRAERPRAIVCWMYHAMIAGTIGAKWASTQPLLIWNVRQSLDDPSSLSRSTRAAIVAARILSRFADGIIYNSSRARSLHAESGFAEHNATVIPNGFELPQVLDVGPKKAKIFGVAARFHVQKDYANFFHAASRVLETHPDARFVAAGRGVLWQNPEIASLARSAGVFPHALDMRGEITDMAEFYRSIDALVLPSRTEGFPNVIGEAMSHGLPVVTTDVGDAAVVVAGAGFVVSPRDNAALADAMRKVLDLSSTEYASYARQARERVENHYTMDLVLKQYQDFLGKC